MSYTAVTDYYWVYCSPDKYELPLAVFDTAQELAEWSGTTVANVRSSVCHAEKGNRKRSKFRRVPRLEPCPICGEPVLLTTKRGKHSRWYRVECPKCGLMLGRNAIYHNKDEIVKVWNGGVEE